MKNLKSLGLVLVAACTMALVSCGSSMTQEEIDAQAEQMTQDLMGDMGLDDEHACGSGEEACGSGEH